jgi:L-ascorbate metabolism protein UlaG (beta-lactamase superfamily)
MKRREGHILRITYVGHATVLVEMEGVRVLTDPLLRRRAGGVLRRCRAVSPAGYGSVDAVLISHMHWDHLDLPSLRMLDRSTRLIVPLGMASLLRREGFRDVDEMQAGATAPVGPLKVTATHAAHARTRHPLGPAADCLGFLLQGPYKVYFAGDTGLFPEMTSLANGLDVALLPVWGWGPLLRGSHMDPRRAAESLRLLRPQVAVPIHWGTFCPLGMGWMRPGFLTRPPHTFAHQAARLAPEVKICVLAPGETLRLGEQPPG